MAQELGPLDISDAPDLMRLVEEVRRSRAPRLLKLGNEPVAILTPVASAEPDLVPPPRGDGRTGSHDPLWNIIGIGDAAGSPDDPTDVSENPDKYLADAYDSPRR